MPEPTAAKNSGYYLLNTDGGNVRRRLGEPLSHAAIGALLRGRSAACVSDAPTTRQTTQGEITTLDAAAAAGLLTIYVAASAEMSIA